MLNYPVHVSRSTLKIVPSGFLLFIVPWTRLDVHHRPPPPSPIPPALDLHHGNSFLASDTIPPLSIAFYLPRASLHLSPSARACPAPSLTPPHPRGQDAIHCRRLLPKRRF